MATGSKYCLDEFGAQDETISTVPSDAAVVPVPADGSLRLLVSDTINTTNNDLYLMLFDAAALPSNGTAPKWRILVRKRTQVTYAFENLDDKYHVGGLKFETGLVLAMSTSLDTLQVTTDNAAYLQAIFRSST
jgi:hypothetical protein